MKAIFGLIVALSLSAAYAQTIQPSGGGGGGTVSNCTTSGGIAFFGATGTTVKCDSGLTYNGGGGIVTLTGPSGFEIIGNNSGFTAAITGGGTTAFLGNNNSGTINGLTFTGNQLLAWNGNLSNNVFNAPDTGMTRSATGMVEVDSGTLGTYRDLTLRHMSGQGAPTQANAACSGFSAATGSSDLAGKISYSSATTCQVAFAATFANPPFCTVTPGSAASTTLITTFTTSMSITFGTANTSFYYTCLGV